MGQEKMWGGRVDGGHSKKGVYNLMYDIIIFCFYVNVLCG